MSAGNENNSSGCSGVCSVVSVGRWLPPDSGIRRDQLVATVGTNPQPARQQPSVTNHGTIGALVTIDIYLSIALSLGAAGVSGLAIKRVSQLMKSLNRSIDKFLPPREQQRVRDLLAQLAILAKADRVVLGIFFDGAMTSKGYHFEKLAVPIAYARPNMPLLPELGKEVPVENVSRELDSLWASLVHEVVITKECAGTECADCALYLERRNLEAIRLHLLHKGATELGILGFHYQSGDGALNELAAPTIKRIELELTEIVGRAGLPKQR